MSSLHELERDVHQFLVNLAYVTKVEVEASVTSRGRKKCKVRTFLDSDSKENRFRLFHVEDHLIERHSSVLFEFQSMLQK